MSGKYPADWKLIAASVKDAAGWKCIRCAHAHAPADGYCLTVHHLDGDKSNSRWWNLLALCQRCHLQIQAKVHPEQSYLWEHSEWFKPYAAAFYAWQRGLNLSRDQIDVLGTVEYLLRVGQPHLVASVEQSSEGATGR